MSVEMILLTAQGHFEAQNYTYAIVAFQQALMVNRRELLQAPRAQRRTLIETHVNIHVDMGHTLCNMGSWRSAITHYKRALRYMMNLLQSESTAVARIHAHLASAYSDYGRYSRAVLYYTLAVDIYNDHNLMESPEVFEWLEETRRNMNLCGGVFSEITFQELRGMRDRSFPRRNH